MQAGRLREQITIQQATVSRDSHGGEMLSWSDLAGVWASVLPGASGERFIGSADQRQATITHTVRIRYLAGIDPRMRIVWGDRLLQIESVVDPDGRRREMVLLCREVV